jgi:hypothetical protein
MKAKLIKKDEHYFLEVEPYTLSTLQRHTLIANTFDKPKGHILQLSKQNCDEIFGVVDVESLALSKASFFGGTYRTPEGFSDEQVGYLHGFIEAMELNKDKVFTSGNMMDMYILGGKYKIQKPDNFLEKGNEIIQSLQQPTEIEVEIEMVFLGFEMESGVKMEEPKLDSEACLILKKI